MFHISDLLPGAIVNLELVSLFWSKWKFISWKNNEIELKRTINFGHNRHLKKDTLEGRSKRHSQEESWVFFLSKIQFYPLPQSWQMSLNSQISIKVGFEAGPYWLIIHWVKAITYISEGKVKQIQIKTKIQTQYRQIYIDY